VTGATTGAVVEAVLEVLEPLDLVCLVAGATTVSTTTVADSTTSVEDLGLLVLGISYTLLIEDLFKCFNA
jgi:hypothetical protein